MAYHFECLSVIRIKHIIIVLIVLALYGDWKTCADIAWSYNGKTGPEHWCRLFPKSQCCHNLQSPIDIRTGGYRQPRPPPLEFIGYSNLLRGVNATNNGLTVQLMIGSDDLGPKPMLRGGLLRGNFVFESAHFHWGRTSKTGSEHTLNKRRYPMEVHLVHRNERYGSEEEARYHSDGFAVLAALFMISRDDNRKFQDLIRTLTYITYKDESRLLRKPLVLDALLPSERDDYVMYWGSETTPPCSQSVIWIVFEDKGRIGSRQIKAFRNLRRETAENDPDYKKALVNNYRPLQPTNYRPLFEVERD